MDYSQLSKEELIERIQVLEKRLIQEGMLPVKTVSAPEAFLPLFDQAEKTVNAYFTDLEMNPSQGTIEIQEERYILVRASAISSQFFSNLLTHYPDKTADEAISLGKSFLYDIGHVLGQVDAKQFHTKMHLKDPIAKLSAGPVHFAYSGWALVEILPESTPTPDEHFFLKYRHPYSFEAHSWLKEGKETNQPICIMNAAYSSGWCSESFGIPLTAVEVTCKAKGDAQCTFIMAPPNQIDAYLEKEISINQMETKPEISFFLERKTIEEKLQQHERLLNSAQVIAKIGSWEFDAIAQQLNWSDEAYHIFEIDSTACTDLMHDYYSRIGQVDISRLNQLFENGLTKGEEYKLEHLIHLPGNRTKHICCSGIPVKDESGKVIKIMGVVQDVSEQKKSEEKLFDSIKEKEVLLKEIHHRVKNNLQIISSLLSLQSSYVNDDRIDSLYRESQNRILSIAAVHELLYQSHDLSKIDYKSYLHKLIGDLMNTYRDENTEVQLIIEADHISLNIDTAVPLGLLINEIITNSLKYGFQGRHKGKISVRLIETQSGSFELNIGDDGIGYPENITFDNSETLGLMLIANLTKQLGGRISKIDSEKGTHYSLEFQETTS